MFQCRVSLAVACTLNDLQMTLVGCCELRLSLGYAYYVPWPRAIITQSVHPQLDCMVQRPDKCFVYSIPFGYLL